MGDTIGNHDGDVQQLEDIDVALEQGLGLVGHGDLRVVMLVEEKLETIGSRNKRVIEKFESIDEVVTVGCRSMNEFNKFSAEAGEALSSCEKHLLSRK